MNHPWTHYTANNYSVKNNYLVAGRYKAKSKAKSIPVVRNREPQEPSPFGLLSPTILQAISSKMRKLSNNDSILNFLLV